MLLIFVGLYLLVKGLLLQSRLYRAYTDLNTTSGILVAYEKDTSANDYYPIISYKVAGEKYFFRNFESWNNTLAAIGSRHTSYYSFPQTKQNPNPPMKATLSFTGKEYKKSWIYISIGLALIWLFGVQNNFSIIFGIAIAGLIHFLRKPKNDININSFREQTPDEEFPNRPLTLAIDESAFDKIPKTEKITLQNNRKAWLSQQKSRAAYLLVAGLACLFLTNYSKINVPEKVAPAAKKITAGDILDAGSLEAAAAKDEQAGDSLCLFFESSSCVYTYMAYDPEYTQLNTERFINLLVLNLGLGFLAFAIFLFNSEKLFITQDIDYSLIKAEQDKDKKEFKLPTV